ncbi:MAG: Eco57I restriction-modification methylase domain-containing protein [Flavobacteriales bacterium]|nr:Eco57I restriction-modification methylase domain-containing protein [Flavobacteriales bacterium]
MKPHILDPKEVLNPAFRKEKPLRSDIEDFKKALITLMNKINDNEREENAKNLVRDFLLASHYKDEFEINTKDSKDLVIHNGNTSNDSVGVIIEAKRPSEKYDFPTKENLNVKATHELILYYLNERIKEKNSDIKHLVMTNGYEWFIIDGSVFYEQVYKNTKLVKDYEIWRLGGKDSLKTEVFYKDIAKPFLDKNQTEIPVTYFNIKDFDDAIRNDNKKDDKELIALYKLLSPVHLLKVPFANDSNSLDKNFYAELLHIIGLEEVKDKGKKVIQRKTTRDNGSLLESAIFILEERDKLSQLKNKERFGSDPKELAFNVALELCITWVNRILFLKLLESQLVAYNKGDKSYRFLNIDTVGDFDKLDSLFFSVLAKKPEERNERVKAAFVKVPYLNSSLFEQTGLEHVLSISMLKSEGLELFGSTVLKDDKSKRRTGELDTLTYFFEFLEAYDFTSEGSEEIQEDSKTLINASVLGLIFEKINGYKDGSFFTPGFITMYMCRETLRKAVLQKFNDKYGWNCQNIDVDLYNKIDNRDEANELVNSLKICDPAVGSGHFLVSALNELLAIKSELKLLVDNERKLLKGYTLEVVNDELIVMDEEHEFFEYKRGNAESQRVQETLFREKQTIIENCLFGVDINHNSVKICRLRLWIELLKNSYYTKESKLTELETLPNIDINIKTGNSLISRFELDADLGKALKKSKWNISSYRLAVDSYRNAKSKDEKRAMQELIATIKGDFRSEIAHNDKRVKRLRTLSGELTTLSTQTQLFAMSKAEKAAFNKRVTELSTETKKLEAELEEIKNNKIYQNAFEWRFEFPEVLNDKGDFVGFDVVIGNPPYFSLSKLEDESKYFETSNYQTFLKGTDIYCLFYELGGHLLSTNGSLTYITSNSWLRAKYGDPLKVFMTSYLNPLALLNIEDIQVFEEATVESNIIFLEKAALNETFPVCNMGFDYHFGSSVSEYFQLNKYDFSIPDSTEWMLGNPEIALLKAKFEIKGKPLGEHAVRINFGIKTGYNEAFIIHKAVKQQLENLNTKNLDLIQPILRGRDLTKYSYTFSDVFLINAHNGLKQQGLNPIDVPKEFPDIFKHLSSYKPKVVERSDQGVHWSNLRNCAYLNDFVKPKIVWGEISDKPKFAYDDKGYYAEATTFLMTGEKLKYLLAILNSNASEWYFNLIGTTTGMGTNRWKKYKIELLPIPLASTEQEQLLEAKVDLIIAAKKANPAADTTALEAEIDGLVYGLYGLSEEEIGIVEGK